MQRASSCRFLLLVALFLGACRQPVPGVLTLAPAGMRTTGQCTTHPDGTLTMPSGATAESVVYVDAGGVTITITASASSLDGHPQVDVWVAGNSVGTAPVPATEARALAFHVQARASGPTALRLAYVTETGTAPEAAPTLHLEKVVITEP